MASDDHSTPLDYKGVMVSSTFTDLVQHRAALMRAIDAQRLKAVAMEHDTARPDVDVIDSSLQMVRDAAAYVGVIGHKYGQIPLCQRRNPEQRSLTQLELNEARRLARPVLLFVMGDDHPVKRIDVETDPEAAPEARTVSRGREASRRQTGTFTACTRCSTTSMSLNVAATQAVAELRRSLWTASDPPRKARHRATQPRQAILIEPEGIPSPPALYAEPPYIGTHRIRGAAESS